jgi:hypothetical protein
MRTTAMKHQAVGADKLAALKVGALFGEMGTGKSRMFYDIGLRKLAAGKASRIVVLCPVSGKSHLADEATKHTGMPAVVHGGEYSSGAGKINIIGIESQSTSIRAMNKLAELSRDAVVVVDQSELIKNRDTARARHIAAATQGSRYRYIASGLAMPNGVEDLWFQMQWLSPLVLGYRSYSEFARFHLRYSGDSVGLRGQGRIIGRFNTDVIAAKIAPYAFEIRKSDCLDLPPKTYSYKSSALDSDGAEAYAEAKRRILYGREAFDVDDATIYKLFTALQLISAGVVPRWLFNPGEVCLSSPKAALLAETIQEISGKAVIWCKYLDEADAAEGVLASHGKRYVRIDGGIPARERTSRIDAFRRDVDFLVCTLQVGAKVHDWGFADYAIYMSNSFDYSLRAESEDRTHRAMMTGKAHYIDLRTETGIERRIARSLQKKEHAVRAFQDKIRQLRTQNTKAARDSIVEEIDAL